VVKYYKDMLLGLELTWSKFLEELRAKFYPITVELQNKKESFKLMMTGSEIVMQYASIFTELS